MPPNKDELHYAFPVLCHADSDSLDIIALISRFINVEDYGTMLDPVSMYINNFLGSTR